MSGSIKNALTLLSIRIGIGPLKVCFSNFQRDFPRRPLWELLDNV